MKNRFNLSDVYPGSQGTPIGDIAAVDANEHQLLGANTTMTPPVDKIKAYNIISAIVVMVLLMVILQTIK